MYPSVALFKPSTVLFSSVFGDDVTNFEDIPDVSNRVQNWAF
jgi:hypothetical protein